jgi:hypothetical protein
MLVCWQGFLKERDVIWNHAIRLIDENGKLKAVSMPRWGNPEGTAFHCVNFGGFAEKEQTFGGYTIPT